MPLIPSQMLDAPQGAWASVHAWVDQQLQVQEAGIASMDRDAQIQLRISQALLAQSQGQWDRVSAPVERARRLQFGQPGRHVAGLLNELLAEQQARRHPDAWLHSAIRDRVLAMPWDEVGGVIHQLRQQLQAMQPQGVRQFVASRLDLSANISKGQASLGFVLQLMGARIQLHQVLPHREALVQGLDEAIARRPAPPPRAPQPAAQPASTGT
ncbi:MAG: hypothetical protein ACK520_13900 [Inhella sp.]|uniref:hypothetical protein n=1 Tax=Inhella sp. TaxID=1921806 RepID=UPI0022BF3366|nr:hypothetical protein [Inhella sp.]MCZ8234471.1 hypothetical protein [Inhella sp.]